MDHIRPNAKRRKDRALFVGDTTIKQRQEGSGLSLLTFTYDDLGRLVTATGWSAWQRRFDYDRWGNRTGVWDATVGGNQIQNVTLQMSGGAPTNRISSITNSGVTSTQTYDSAGNLTNDGAHSYQYDGEGRIASVDTSGATYNYDSANRRVKKVTGGYTTYYIWEGAQVIAEYSNATAGAGGTSYYLADRLSTRMITDGNGAFKGTQDHLAFGEEAGTTGTSEKHRFTNYERDGEGSNDYAMNRQYQNAAGRFLRPDPLAGSISAPQEFNRYSYTANDPINSIDPVGLSQIQNQSVCPAQFGACAEVDVCFGSVCGRVMVGLDGLGGGEFIWGNSTFTDKQLLTFNEYGLPKSFTLGLSFGRPFNFFAPDYNAITSQVLQKARKEVEDCAKAGRAGLNGSNADAAKFLKFIGRRIEGKVKFEAYKALARTALEKGIVSGESFLGRQLFRFSKGAIVSPAGVALLFLQLSYEMAPTAEEMEMSNISYQILQDCREAVSRKYGIKV